MVLEPEETSSITIIYDGRMPFSGSVTVHVRDALSAMSYCYDSEITIPINLQSSNTMLLLSLTF